MARVRLSMHGEELARIPIRLAPEENLSIHTIEFCARERDNTDDARWRWSGHAAARGDGRAPSLTFYDTGTEERGSQRFPEFHALPAPGPTALY